MFKNLSIIHKLNLIVFLLLTGLSGAITAALVIEIDQALKQDVIERQNKNITVAAAILEREMPAFEAENLAEKSQRFELETIPTFYSHKMIDEIGKITGETATIFIWDPKTQDYWRKTTNIVKDDGQRAIGTPLGKDGVVYPFIHRGETYIGEATILGKEYYTRYEPVYLKGTDKVAGILYVGLEKAQFDKKMADLIFREVSIAIMLTLLIVLIMHFFLRKVLKKPFLDIRQQMQSLAEGDKEIEIEGEQRRDEIGDMARTLTVFKHNMIEQERLQKEKEEAQKKDAKRAEKMRESINSFEKTIADIAVNLTHSSSSLQELSSKFTKTLQRTTEQSSSVASASQQASTNVQTVAAGAEELSSSIGEISRNISETSDMAKSCSESADMSQNNLKELQSSIGEIDSVIQSINDVAEQTNLLALNATIEAARAGEAGKGFAVVANEVKALANETHKMTEEISKKVEGIKSSADNTIGSVSKIIEQIDSIDEKTSSVAAAVEEQNRATQEISQSVQQASDGTAEVSKNIEEVQKAAQESFSATDDLKSASDDLTDNAQTLKKTLESFLRDVKAD